MDGDQVKASSKSFVEASELLTNNRQKIFIENPLLWSTDFPELYQLISELYLLNGKKLASKADKGVN